MIQDHKELNEIRLQGLPYFLVPRIGALALLSVVVYFLSRSAQDEFGWLELVAYLILGVLVGLFYGLLEWHMRMRAFGNDD